MTFSRYSQKWSEPVTSRKTIVSMYGKRWNLNFQVKSDFWKICIWHQQLGSFSDEISDIGLRRPKPRCRPDLAPICQLWEELASNLIQVVGQIQFPAVVGLRFPFPWWQPAKGHSRLLEGTYIPLHMSPFYLWASNGIHNPSHDSIWLPLWSQLEKTLLKGSH